MKSNFLSLIAAAAITTAIVSCSKTDSTVAPPPPVPVVPVDTVNALKDATDITIGIAVPYNGLVSNATYAGIVKRDFDGITMENEMKHFSIVQSDGTMNFSRPDAMINAAAGMEVFGHTLAWHSGQNASYLKSFAGTTPTSSPELMLNGDFESGTATTFNNWSTYNAANGATISVGSGASEVRTGARSLKVSNPVANATDQWRVQVASDLINTVSGKQYTITYYVKAATAGGSIRLSTATAGGGTAQYQADQSIGTNFSQVTWTITANAPQTRILFDLGQVANTYFIDDVSVKEASNTINAAKVDEALGNFVTAMVSRYKGKVKAWDVVNEVLTESGNIRNNANTLTSNPPSDVFVWSEYLGRDFALKAFNYAKAADPNALLFINDYNLESSTAKLDSLIAYVAELRSKGAKIDGIGTQMHVSWNTNTTGIDNMMKKLAATGLKIRVSELDVRVNPASTAGFVLTDAAKTNQATMFKYIVKSYLANVPKAQQYGITFWGLNDNTSWLYKNGLDYPLLYNDDYTKKPAYTAVLQALKGQ